MNDDAIKHSLGLIGTMAATGTATAWTLQRVNEWGTLFAWVASVVCALITVNSWWQKRKARLMKDTSARDESLHHHHTHQKSRR